MKDLYGPDQYFFEFENDEIMRNIIEPVQIHYGVDVYYAVNENDNPFDNGKGKIKYVSFDGLKLDFYVRFYKHLIAIFILGEEFMFFDDNTKETQTSSDTYGNIVYEGTFRDKTHDKILKIVFKFIEILWGTKKIFIKKEELSQKGIQYPKCTYEIKLTNDFETEQKIKFENILFFVNM